MRKSSHDHPNVGTLVRDTATDRLGVYMGRGGPYAMIRPQLGGKEWQVPPEDLRLAEVSRA
ncbi:hypothetical protein AB0B12_31775 [Streptomyces sp. NPDC044780]|uniref:hypothetical protein n=1 Tax=unclassified Streptomyces TaxID=2593676 RepID=UPI0033E52217